MVEGLRRVVVDVVADGVVVTVVDLRLFVRDVEPNENGRRQPLRLGSGGQRTAPACTGRSTVTNRATGRKGQAAAWIGRGTCHSRRGDCASAGACSGVRNGGGVGLSGVFGQHNGGRRVREGQRS